MGRDDFLADPKVRGTEAFFRFLLEPRDLPAPVSYTHLFLSGGVGCVRGGSVQMDVIVSSGTADIIRTGNYRFFFLIEGRCGHDVCPVSYTHLDVYKRQMQYIAHHIIFYSLFLL